MSMINLIVVIVIGGIIYLNMFPPNNDQIGMDTDTFNSSDRPIPSDPISPETPAINSEIIKQRQNMAKRIEMESGKKLAEKREQEESIKMTLASDLVKNAGRLPKIEKFTSDLSTEFASVDTAPLPASLKLVQSNAPPSKVPKPFNPENGFYQSADFRSEMTIDWNDKISNGVKPHMFTIPPGNNIKIVDPSEWQRFLGESGNDSLLLQSHNNEIMPYTIPDTYGKLV